MEPYARGRVDDTVAAPETRAERRDRAAAETRAAILAAARSTLLAVGYANLSTRGVAEADCDDGCQRVWVVLAQKLDSIEPTKIRSYIFSVIVRVASEMRRNYRRHQHVEFDELSVEPGRPDVDGHDTEVIVAQQQVRQLLDQMLAGLSWDLRTVFVMYEIEGYSHQEIARTLGVAETTSKGQLFRARTKLRESLKHFARGNQ